MLTVTHPWKSTPCARPPETDDGVVSVPIHKRELLWNVGHVRPSESGDRLLHPKHRGVLLNSKEGVGGSLNLGLIHRPFLSAPSPSHRLGAFCVSGGIPAWMRTLESQLALVLCAVFIWLGSCILGVAVFVEATPTLYFILGGEVLCLLIVCQYLSDMD